MARNKGTRLISYTEVSTALTCEARWDFKYGGHLLDGETLKRRSTATRLSDGSAWGAGIAEWHRSAAAIPELAERYAAEKIWESLKADAEAMADRGVHVGMQAVREQYDRLRDLLAHHVTVADALPNLTLIEGRFAGPVPSRGGKRGSNLYHFENYIDGYSVVPEGGWRLDGRYLAPGEWIVENKLRDDLHPADLIVNLRQYLWYCWQAAKAKGLNPVGIIVMERKNDLPHPAKINQPTKAQPLGPVSTKKDQITSRALVEAALDEREIPADERGPWAELLGNCDARRWHQSVPVKYRPSDYVLAGRELTSAAALIGELDTARRWPLRNASTITCRGCDFKAICPDPAGSSFAIDAEFIRTSPKRLRGADRESTDAPSHQHADTSACAANSQPRPLDSRLAGALEGNPFAAAAAQWTQEVTP